MDWALDKATKNDRKNFDVFKGIISKMKINVTKNMNQYLYVERPQRNLDIFLLLKLRTSTLLKVDISANEIRSVLKNFNLKKLEE